MEQSIQPPSLGPAQVAGRILVAWRNGESMWLQHELENARFLASRTQPSSTLEMETMEALSGAVESLEQRSGRHAGAVRLLEHLAQRGPELLKLTAETNG
jgi:hypothetical protein